MIRYLFICLFICLSCSVNAQTEVDEYINITCYTENAKFDLNTFCTCKEIGMITIGGEQCHVCFSQYTPELLYNNYQMEYFTYKDIPIFGYVVNYDCSANCKTDKCTYNIGVVLSNCNLITSCPEGKEPKCTCDVPLCNVECKNGGVCNDRKCLCR